MAQEVQDLASSPPAVTRDWGAAKIVGLYALVGGLWILFSDQLVRLIVNSTLTFSYLSMVKGWLYVAVTALLLYGLIRRHTASLRHSERGSRLLAMELRAANERLEQSLAQEQAARLELEATNGELESFTYTVSHDLRAPLNFIRQFSHLLLDQYGEVLPAEGQLYLRQILANASTTDALAEDLLTLSRATRVSLQKQSIDMRQLVDQVVAESQARGDLPRAEIRIGNLPPADADPVLLKQVWNALLSNALKFTRPGTAAHIEIGALPETRPPVYLIKDDGVGFDMAQSDRLFRAFQRLHNPEEFPGTGLGLAIVQQIIRRHGGRVWAEGKVDHGACFYFTLSADDSA